MWLLVALAYLLVSFALLSLARFTPLEWRTQTGASGLVHLLQRDPLAEAEAERVSAPETHVEGERRRLERRRVALNQFNFASALWFTVGSLMQQGCDINPRAVSTRLVAGTWWYAIERSLSLNQLVRVLRSQMHCNLEIVLFAHRFFTLIMIRYELVPVRLIS